VTRPEWPPAALRAYNVFSSTEAVLSATAIKKMISIDFPGQHERIVSANDAFRVGAESDAAPAAEDGA